MNHNPSILLILLLCTGSLVYSQAIWTIDYNQNAQWTRDNAGNQIYLSGGKVIYQGATNGSNRRIYRRLPSPIKDSCWKLNFEVYAGQGGQNNATGTLLLGLTKDNDCPLNTCNSTSGANTKSNETGLLISILSARSGQYPNFAIRIKNQNQVTTTNPIAPINFGQKYFFQLQRKNDSILLHAYSDSLKTNPLPGSPSLGILDSNLNNFKFIQHSTYPQGDPARKFTGWTKGVRYKSNCKPCQSEEVWIEGQRKICIKDSTMLKVPKQWFNSNLIHWSTGDSSTGVKIKREGLYWVRIDSGGCTYTDTIEIINKNTNFPKIPKDTIICKESYIDLDNFINHDNTSIESEVKSFPEIQLNDTIFYKLYNLCDTIDGNIVLLKKSCRCENLRIPNFFTPNNDNRNDNWHIQSNCIFTGYNLTITDRNGKVIMKTNDSDDIWNGTIRGEKAPHGVYFYLLRYKFNSHWKIKRGTITIMY